MLRQVLIELIANDRTLTRDVKRLEAMLRDLGRGEKVRIKALVETQREGVMIELERGSEPAGLLVRRLSQRVIDNVGLRDDLAYWAVESWALALGVLNKPLPEPYRPQTSLPRPAPPPSDMINSDTYRHIIEMAWADQRLDAAEVALLKSKQGELGLTDAAVVEIETAVMGTAKETVLQRQSGTNRDQYGLYTDRRIQGIVQRFRWIEPGEFLMGSPTTDVECYSDETQHKVILTQGFWLADTACTQAVWQAVMGNNPSCFQGSERPVENVSWNDTQQFMARLNALVPGGGFRLPTEAEWEYACRAGTTTPFWFGSQITSDQVNYNGNYPYAGGRQGKYRGETVDVKALPCNHWGLYQMHGNVWEWCQDWFGDYPSATVRDPTGPATGGARVYRGGSWLDGARGVRAAYRGRRGPGDRAGYLGFRPALVQVSR